MNFIFSNIFSITFSRKKSLIDFQNSDLFIFYKLKKNFFKTTTCLLIEKLPYMTESGGIFSCNLRY